jgi:hypothetical protein
LSCCRGRRLYRLGRGGDGDRDREGDGDGEREDGGEREAEGGGGRGSEGGAEMVSRKVETARSRSKLWLSRKKRASCGVEEVMEQNVVIRSE